MNKLEIAKTIIKEHFKDGDCGLYDTRNESGDIMQTLYDHDNLQIDICKDYRYFEVFGLSYGEFEELGKFYISLRKQEMKEENKTIIYGVTQHGENFMVLVTPYATYGDLKITINRYKADNSVCVDLWNNEEGAIARLTTCLNQKGKLKDNESYLDTNNCPWVIGFIKKYNLGEVSEFRCGYSEYCTYPVVTWNMDELKKYE